MFTWISPASRLNRKFTQIATFKHNMIRDLLSFKLLFFCTEI